MVLVLEQVPAEGAVRVLGLELVRVRVQERGKELEEQRRVLVLVREEGVVVLHDDCKEEDFIRFSEEKEKRREGVAYRAT